MAFLRSLIFTTFQWTITPVFTVISLLTFPFSRLTRYRIITTWSRWVVRAAEVLCGIRYRVIGLENLPKEPCVILSKHQSDRKSTRLNSSH